MRCDVIDEHGQPIPGDPAPHDAPCLGTGAYALDQAWHHLWLLIAAAVTVLIA